MSALLSAGLCFPANLVNMAGLISVCLYGLGFGLVMDLSFLIAPFIISPRKNVIRKCTKFRPALASSYINYFVVVATLRRENRKELWSMAVFGQKGKTFISL